VVDGKTATDMGTFKLVITEDTSLTFSANLTKKDASCFGGNNGEVYAHINGGIAPYSYSWSGSQPNNDTITGLTAGNYTLTVNDNQGCSTTATVTVGQPAQLTLATSATAVSCGGANNGSATATPTGGTSPYAYIWNSNPAQTSQTAVLLTAGTYFVTVTDLNGCTVSGSTTVSPTTTIVVATDSVKNVTCFGANDGKIYISVTGGQTPYNYVWSNSLPAQQDQTGLAPGSYTATITDAAQCVTNVAFNVTEPTQLSTVINNTISANCPDSEDGGADLTVNGGTQPYAFNWSNGTHLNSLFSVAPGSYSVTVTDANNCTATQTATVTFNGTAIATSITHTDANCLQDVTGTADLTVNGGAGGYTFYWSNYATTQNVTNLRAGTYSVVVTDANGCVKVDTVTIQELAPGGVCDTTTDTTTVPVNNKPYVMVPNAFSPNGDGQNDIFAFYMNHAVSVEVSIFNRTGSLVYHNPNQASGDGWKGRFRDRDAPSGTYVYVLNIKFDDGTSEQKTGSVVLIR
jgi:gliding motility-associated-like protein